MARQPAERAALVLFRLCRAVAFSQEIELRLDGVSPCYCGKEQNPILTTKDTKMTKKKHPNGLIQHFVAFASFVVKLGCGWPNCALAHAR